MRATRPVTSPPGSEPLHDPPEHASDAKAARKKAMDYLARREYGRRELRDKLIGAGFVGDVAAEAVARLAAENLQDDGRFAAALLQSRINQGKGPVRIRQELEQRGIDAVLIDEALDNCGEDWLDLARRVRGRKFGSGLPSGFPAKARQMRFLQYRGFTSDQVQAAVSPDENR